MVVSGRASIRALVFSFGALLSHCSHASDPPPLHLAGGDGPATVVLADVNGDGALDIAVANERGGTVSVYLNGGRRRFSRGPNSPIAAGPNPNDIAVGDFNRDGNPDLAFANHDTQSLTVLIGDGHGSFAPASFSPIHVAVKPHPHGVAAGDFDGDGFADLVTDSWAVNRLRIVFNPGADASPWTRSTEVEVGRHPYQRIRVADLDRDGRADIVSPNLDGNDVTVLLGDGHGGFRQPPGSPFPAGDSPFAVAVGDVDADGIPDLAVVDSPSSAGRPGKDGVTILRGDGDGGFRAIDGSPFPTNRFPNQAAIGDLDGDGVGDVLVSLPEDDAVAVFHLSRGGAGVRRETIPVAGHPRGVAIADLDGDGNADIVTANSAANSITVIFGRVPSSRKHSASRASR